MSRSDEQSHDGPVLTDEEIAALSPAERRELIIRLGRPLEQIGLTRRELREAQRVRLVLLAVSAVLLVPWIGYLALTLPERHQVRSWDATWVGFDVLLLAMLVASLLLAWRRRLLVLPALSFTGALLVCDAWFDVITAGSWPERWWSIGSAVLVELPLAAVLVGWALRVLRLLALRLWLADPGDRLWQVALPGPRRGVSRTRATSRLSR